MPEVFTGLAAILIAAGIGALSLHARTKLFPRHPRHSGMAEREPQDVTGYVTTMVGVFYALIVGLSLVSVWGNRDAAVQDSRTEAAALHEVYVLAADLPTATRQQIQGDAAAYVHYVEAVEWPLMQRGAPLPETDLTMLSTIRSAVASYQPVTAVQSITAADIVNDLGRADEACAGRRSAASLRLPPLIWVGLCLGGILTVTLAFVHGMERHLRHLTVIMSLTSLVGFITILIYFVNNPFAPGLGAGDGAFTSAFPSS